MPPASPGLSRRRRLEIGSENHPNAKWPWEVTTRSSRIRLAHLFDPVLAVHSYDDDAGRYRGLRNGQQTMIALEAMDVRLGEIWVERYRRRQSPASCSTERCARNCSRSEWSDTGTNGVNSADLVSLMQGEVSGLSGN